MFTYMKFTVHGGAHEAKFKEGKTYNYSINLGKQNIIIWAIRGVVLLKSGILKR